MARSLLAVVAVALGLAVFSPVQAVVPPLKQPAWTDLSAEQKQILAPLAGEWNKLESFRQKKWLDIARRYPTMSAEEQARIQRRMQDWVKLSPEERKAAREKYKNLKKAPPEHKEAVKQKWEEYKLLPEEEKQRLKNEAARNKGKPQTKSGAAMKASAPPAVAAPKPAALPASEQPTEPPPTPSAAPEAPPPAQQ